MRRLAALALRALSEPALRPTAQAGPAAARALAWHARPDAPPPPRLARQGEFLSGVAHSAQWRVGHRFKARAAATWRTHGGAALMRGSQVLVEFDTKDVDRFIALADALEVRQRGAAPSFCTSAGPFTASRRSPPRRKPSQTCRWRATWLACARGAFATPLLSRAPFAHAPGQARRL